VPVKANFTGRLPVGLKLVKMRIEPQQVRLLIRRSHGAGVDSLATEPIQLGQVHEDTAVHPRLQLPPLTRLTDQSQAEVKVIIDVAKTGK
jgi:YbbR domain-containing protein